MPAPWSKKTLPTAYWRGGGSSTDSSAATRRMKRSGIPQRIPAPSPVSSELPVIVSSRFAAPFHSLGLLDGPNSQAPGPNVRLKGRSRPGERHPPRLALACLWHKQAVRPHTACEVSDHANAAAVLLVSRVIEPLGWGDGIKALPQKLRRQWTPARGTSNLAVVGSDQGQNACSSQCLRI